MGRHDDKFTLHQAGRGEVRLTVNPTGQDPDQELINQIKNLAGCSGVRRDSGRALIITQKPGLTDQGERALCRKIGEYAELFCDRIGA